MLCLHRRGCSFWFPHRCFITSPHLSRDRSPTVFVSHTSLLPCGCFQLCNSLGRICLFHAKISVADRSGTSYQPLGYSDNTGPPKTNNWLYLSLCQSRFQLDEKNIHFSQCSPDNSLLCDIFISEMNVVTDMMRAVECRKLATVGSNRNLPCM